MVARSYFVLHLYMQDLLYGQYDYPVQVMKHMMTRGIPSVFVQSEEGTAFVYQCLVPLYETFKVHLHHPSRQRQRIASMLQDWQLLQQKAQALDTRLCSELNIPEASYPRYFTAWTMGIVLRMMQQYLTLGFQLELYDVEEYVPMLWYMDCLSSTRMQVLQSTLQFLEQMNAHVNATAQNPSAQKPPPPTPAILQLQWEIQKLQVHRALGRGICQFLSALYRDGVLKTTKYAYGSPLIRFEHRVAPFQVVDFPSPLQYEDFVHNNDFSKYEVLCLIGLTHR